MIVQNIKPVLSSVENVKGKMNSVSIPQQVYTEMRTIRVGQPMGLLLALTYPNTFSFTATRL